MGHTKKYDELKKNLADMTCKYVTTDNQLRDTEWDRKDWIKKHNALQDANDKLVWDARIELERKVELEKTLANLQSVIIADEDELRVEIYDLHEQLQEASDKYDALDGEANEWLTRYQKASAKLESREGLLAHANKQIELREIEEAELNADIERLRYELGVAKSANGIGEVFGESNSYSAEDMAEHERLVEVYIEVRDERDALKAELADAKTPTTSTDYSDFTKAELIAIIKQML